MRVVIAVVAIAVCLFLIQASARIGFSRLLAKYALVANSIPAADAAVRLSPSDPENHRARATVLSRVHMPAEAVKSLESATSLRYRDDYLWLELGNAREESDNPDAALAALDQAVRWAPYYAHTHWQRGNLLLRMGKRAEAFVELRKAAAANQDYLPNLIDLAWGFSGADVQATEALIEIKNDKERLAFVRFLARRGKGNAVIDQIRLLTTPVSDENKKELAQLLFTTKSFSEAYHVWTAADGQKPREPALFNGGFEEPLLLNETGFGGWILSPAQTKNNLAIDASENFAGTRSLRITLQGNWNPGTPLLSQTVLVEPLKTYRISFSVKTKDLVTGGPPLFAVNDATTDQLVGKSENFPATASWVKLNFDFTTLASSEAVVIRLHRNSCEPSPCPIFGVVWLDEISIEQVKRADQ
jgi:tetratricopeptide (TPR) repeat protein